MMRRIKTYIHDLTGLAPLSLETGTASRAAGRSATSAGTPHRTDGSRSAFSSGLRPFSQTLTEDVLKSSEIEGEILDRGQVRSSIARRLGIDIGGLTAPTGMSRASSR